MPADFARSAAALLTVLLLLTGCGGSKSVNTSTELPVDCLTKPQPGPCRAALTRYYYDYRDNRCKPFTYGGCDGRVPFETAEACREHCGADPR